MSLPLRYRIKILGHQALAVLVAIGFAAMSLSIIAGAIFVCFIY